MKYDYRISSIHIYTAIRAMFLIFMLNLLAACLTTNTSGETIVRTFKVSEKKYGKVSIPVELNFPSSSFQKPYPLIITQHGSTRDGRNFINGKGRMDEFSKRMISMATKKGFAVAAIDAFYGKSLSPTDKKKFPRAQFYAYEIKKKLAVDKRIDPHAIFYTGFSYGGEAVLRSTAISTHYIVNPWRAAAAEPSCNAFPEPRQVNYPILIVKGGESHYETKPCRIFMELYKDKGSNVELIIFPQSNHNFSHNGKFVKGIAFNGCADNPVILRRNGKHTFLNGESASRQEIHDQCFTLKGGSGNDREDLDIAISAIINFFLKQ